MNEKQNRFIASVATKNVLVLIKKYRGHALTYLPSSLTADNDLEVNRNLNNKPNHFN